MLKKNTNLLGWRFRRLSRLTVRRFLVGLSLLAAGCLGLFLSVFVLLVRLLGLGFGGGLLGSGLGFRLLLDTA